MRGAGAPHDKPQWSWSCHLHGRPQGSDDRGTGVDLDDANIADAREIAEASAEALARYDRRKPF
jgi:hypothetical protein